MQCPPPLSQGPAAQGHVSTGSLGWYPLPRGRGAWEPEAGSRLGPESDEGFCHSLHVMLQEEQEGWLQALGGSRWGAGGSGDYEIPESPRSSETPHTHTHGEATPCLLLGSLGQCPSGKIVGSRCLLPDLQSLSRGSGGRVCPGTLQASSWELSGCPSIPFSLSREHLVGPARVWPHDDEETRASVVYPNVSATPGQVTSLFQSLISLKKPLWPNQPLQTSGIPWPGDTAPDHVCEISLLGPVTSSQHLLQL